MYKKVLPNEFLGILSNSALERDILSSQYFPMLTLKDVRTINFNGKTAFSINHDLIRNDYLSKINSKFLRYIKTNSSSVSYKEKFSYLDFFQPHTESYNFIRLDLKSFFHSISYEMVRNVFEAYIEKDYLDLDVQQRALDMFMNLVMLNVNKSFPDKLIADKKILPIGFPTSPLISNIVFRKFDIIIQEFCEKNNIIYTRYADDMLFSSNSNDKILLSDRFSDEISYIVSTGGFKINKSKTIKSTAIISINGYVIDSFSTRRGLRLSGKKISIIKKILYFLDKGLIFEEILKKFSNNIFNKEYNEEYKYEYEKSQIVNLLLGHRSYLISFHKFNDKWNCVDELFIKDTSKIIKNIEKKVDYIQSK